MSDGLKQARKALGRGDADEALVLLWNALEPVRPATAQVEAEVERGGEDVETEEAASKAPGGLRLRPILWLLVLIALVLFNLLSQGRG